MFQSFKTIFYKDFAAFFRSGNGYIILGIYAVLSFASAFYFGGYFTLDNTSLISFFYFQPDILTVMLPAVTMRSWADERRLGTIEYLLTQPVSYAVAVWAKYCATCLLGLLMLAITLPLWLTSSFLIEVDNLNIFSAYLACFLTICTFCALGCAVSAFNKNTVIAYIITIFVLWGIYSINLDFLLTSTQQFSDEVFAKVIRSLNFSKHYQDVISGQIGLDNLIYFLTLIFPALWVNVVALDYKKQ